MLRTARQVLAAFALCFGTALVVPLVHSYLRLWAETRGYDVAVFEQVDPAVARLAAASETTTFLFVTGFLIGGALLVWLDYGLRQRTQKMGLILASVGLAVFVVGIGIFLFPRPSSLAIAKATPAAPKAVPAREPLAWSKTPILAWSQQADGTIYAHALGFVGKNVGAEDVQLDNIYIVSRVSGTRMDLKVEIPNEESVAAQDTNPIPPDAYIQLSSDEFNPSVGISEAEFLRDWGTIDLIVEYDGKRHQLTFDQTTIVSLFDAQRPKPTPPIVTRKADAHPAAAACPPKVEEPIAQKSEEKGSDVSAANPSPSPSPRADNSIQPPAERMELHDATDEFHGPTEGRSSASQ
jgi:hypothetical protein